MSACFRDMQITHTGGEEAWELPHYHPVVEGGAVEWETSYSSEPPARQVSALRLTPHGAAWNGAAAGKTHYCETDCREL